jgi:hypothetical protein
MGSRHDPTNLWTPDYRATIEEFAVLDAEGHDIWRIRGTGLNQLIRIEYGRLPEGFRQETPSPPQRPRVLRDGERVTLKAVTDEAVLEHSGWALGSDGFRGGVYHWTPRKWPGKT